MVYIVYLSGSPLVFEFLELSYTSWDVNEAIGYLIYHQEFWVHSPLFKLEPSKIVDQLREAAVRDVVTIFACLANLVSMASSCSIFFSVLSWRAIFKYWADMYFVTVYIYVSGAVICVSRFSLLRLMFASLVMSSIWLFQASFCEMMTPIHLLLFVFIRVSSWLRFEIGIGVFVVVTLSTSNLLHCSRLRRSVCKQISMIECFNGSIYKTIVDKVSCSWLDTFR